MLAQWANYQLIPTALDLHILQAIGKTQFFGDANGLRIAAFENTRLHNVSLA